MGLIVSNKKYKAALGEIEELKRIIDFQSIALDRLHREIKEKEINHKTRVELTYIFKTIIETMEEKHESEIKRYRDSEIELLLATKKRCKKARVKTKYKNKILKIAEKRLLELERQA